MNANSSVTSAAGLGIGLYAIVERELFKFARQTERLLSSLVRPLLWLLVFATGLNNLLGVSIIDPYQTYTPYQEYILPGMIGIVVLFQCMQSALSMVYDREAGVMRVMLVSPLPRSFLLFAKIFAASILAAGQAYAFLLIARMFNIYFPATGYIFILPAIMATGLMLGALGLLISVYTRQIENFAGMMNFVVFPMFFFSSSLYPLWKLREAGAEAVFQISSWNPFTHGVELIRFAAYGQFNALSCLVVVGVAVLAFLLALWGYDPNRGQIGRIKRD